MLCTGKSHMQSDGAIHKRTDSFSPGNCVDQSEYCASSGLNEICSVSNYRNNSSCRRVLTLFCFQQADNFCYSEVEALLDNIPGRDEYDIRELQPDVRSDRHLL